MVDSIERFLSRSFPFGRGSLGAALVCCRGAVRLRGLIESSLKNTTEDGWV